MRTKIYLQRGLPQLVDMEDHLAAFEAIVNGMLPTSGTKAGVQAEGPAEDYEVITETYTTDVDGVPFGDSVRARAAAARRMAA